LTVSVDGSGSRDEDGTVASYDWDWGDNTAHGSGVSADHTYAQSGTYTVTLTVTDNAGATGVADRSVTVSEDVTPELIASDDFGRSATKGWGEADLGGSWTTTGAKTNFEVSGGVGTITVPKAPGGPSVSLDQVSTSAADVTVELTPEEVPTGSGSYISVLGRTVGSAGSYRAVLNLAADGSMNLGLTRVDAAGTARIAAPTVIDGLTYAGGTSLVMRVVVTGTSPTQIMAKVWKQGTAEPAGWQVSGVDSAAGMQAPGSVGLMSYLSANATNPPYVTRFDSLRVYDSAPQQVMGLQLQRKLDAAPTAHKSEVIPLDQRDSLPFTKTNNK
jgi:hypothetical protein